MKNQLVKLIVQIEVPSGLYCYNRVDGAPCCRFLEFHLCSIYNKPIHSAEGVFYKYPACRKHELDNIQLSQPRKPYEKPRD